MPSTRRQKNKGEKPENSPKKRSSSGDSAVDMENVNSNHSATYKKSSKLKDSINPKVKSTVKAVSTAKEIPKQGRSTVKIQFEEEDEVIDMETDDGDKARHEFQSEGEEEGELSSDEGSVVSDDDETQPT